MSSITPDMIGDLASSAGTVWGAGRLAKGYDQAGEHFDDLAKDAYTARGFADPWGASGYRQESGDYLAKLLRGEVDFTADPGYQWTMQQALQATSRQQAASGFNNSGNMQTALQDRAAGLASTEYAKIIERLTGLAGATPQNAVGGANVFGDMTTAARTGQADMVLGKYSSLAQRDQATAETVGNVAKIFAGAGFSDKRLKTKVRKIGKDGPINLYSWEWNKTANETFGLKGKSTGYIAQEVRDVYPDAITEIKGYLAIDYGYVNEVLRGTI